MTNSNHIVGGITFTGIFASFWDINIFSNINFIAITVIGSLLPDIDYPKSIIGFIFYPLAKFINYRYGPRTITHSLILLIPMCIIIYYIGFAEKLKIEFLFYGLYFNLKSKKCRNREIMSEKH